MGLDIGTAGAQAAGGVVGTMLGLALENHEDQRQAKQNQVLTDQQVAANEKLAQYSQGLQLDTWNKTNYEAQVQHIENAGLNPALMYGMGGGGGVTTGSASAGTVGRSSGTNTGGEAQAAGQMGMGIALQAAQIQNIQAQTKLTEAQTAKTAGVDTDVAKANLDQIGATTGNIKADTIVKQLQQGLMNIQTSIAQNTKADVETAIWANGMKAVSEANSAAAHASVDGATIQPRIDMAVQQVINMGIQAEATRAGIQLTQAQTQAATESAVQMYNSIKQNWKSLDQKQQQIQIEQQKTKLIERGLNQQLAGQIAAGVATMAGM